MEKNQNNNSVANTTQSLSTEHVLNWDQMILRQIQIATDTYSAVSSGRASMEQFHASVFSLSVLLEGVKDDLFKQDINDMTRKMLKHKPSRKVYKTAKDYNHAFKNYQFNIDRATLPILIRLIKRQTRYVVEYH